VSELEPGRREAFANVAAKIKLKEVHRRSYQKPLLLPPKKLFPKRA
jgi:hypothetical protein